MGMGSYSGHRLDSGAGLYERDRPEFTRAETMAVRDKPGDGNEGEASIGLP